MTVKKLEKGLRDLQERLQRAENGAFDSMDIASLRRMVAREEQVIIEFKRESAEMLLKIERGEW